MGNTFRDALKDAARRQDAFRHSEIERVHQKAVRDPKHVYQKSEIRKPDLWSHRNPW